jgi:hypothetical protein
VFTNDSTHLIDFDLSGKQKEKLYPAGFNLKIEDGKRHPTAQPFKALLPEHDWFSLSYIMKLYSMENREAEWESLCSKIEKGDWKEIEQWDKNLFIVKLPGFKIGGVSGLLT